MSIKTINNLSNAHLPIYLISDNLMKEDMLMVNFFPKLEDSPTSTAKGEYIFVIDRSGMS